MPGSRLFAARGKTPEYPHRDGIAVLFLRFLTAADELTRSVGMGLHRTFPAVRRFVFQVKARDFARLGRFEIVVLHVNCPHGIP